MTSSHNVVARYKEASSKKPLYGHTDEASAYVVDDYPYGFKLRTKIRYWLEFTPKKGYRFVSQTMDPKKSKPELGIERWNAPKKSTYAQFAGAMYLDGQGHVQWEGLGVYSNDDKVMNFVKDFPHADLRIIKDLAKAKIKYLSQIISGQAVWKINGVPQTPSEEEIGEKRKELENWEELSRRL